MDGRMSHTNGFTSITKGLSAFCPLTKKETLCMGIPIPGNSLRGLVEMEGPPLQAERLSAPTMNSHRMIFHEMDAYIKHRSGENEIIMLYVWGEWLEMYINT
ncbi:hypothetical protein CEXT_796291 [Caerostris extrusa]|uniref:Uncharacterized protein n=1 Tax=Caerostris extrusa TaxID=172846 RepID=A0AAV4TKJ1_CAEEX|nr:hypothetical protein CEXT_796291 [Caerostris extrusa]